MSDITTQWTLTRGDYAVAGADLAAGGDLATAMLISLFTDRVAGPDDIPPDGTGDPRGWWGDVADGVPIGSRLWLLERAKRTQETLSRAQDYIAEALQWLIDDGVVARFEIHVEWTAATTLSARVTAVRTDGTNTSQAYAWAWNEAT